MRTRKKILLTGASGFIGLAIYKKLIEEYIVTRTTRVKANANAGDMLYLDLTKLETIANLSDLHDFDIVVHFGAQIGWSEKDEQSMLISNVISTSLLARQAEKMGAKFILASAAIVHGVSTQDININSETNPDTPYGKSKWLAEELVKVAGVEYCILRIGGVFGLNGPSHLGLNLAISNALNNIAPIVHGTGDVNRNYIYLWDVAEAVDYVIRNNITGTHLLASSETISVSSMLENVCSVLMPDLSPKKCFGKTASNQLITPSNRLPKTRSFRNSLKDIKLRAGV